MTPALLTRVDCSNHIHLIIGSNPLAGARCSRSVEVGAKPKLIAAENASIHYGITKRIEAGEVEWMKSDFKDEHLTTLGRPEVDCVVDAVFVTLSNRDPLSRFPIPTARLSRLLTPFRDSYLKYLPSSSHTRQCYRFCLSFYFHSPKHAL